MIFINKSHNPDIIKEKIAWYNYITLKKLMYNTALKTKTE